MEVNNNKAMCEALELVNKIYDMLSKPCIVIEEVRQECRKARAALISTPPRNCDVGTPAEQAKRKQAYCKDCGCRGCPISAGNTLLCDLGWAQMPYNEGGKNDQKKAR